MSKGNRSQIKSGAILSYLNIGLGNLIPIFYTPIMLALLGQSEYGLYKIAASTSSYLTLMSLGIGSAVSRYLIKARTEGGKAAEEKVFGIFHRIFQYLSIATCIIGIGIVLFLDELYGKSLTNAELHTMQILVLLMVGNTVVGFSSSAYASVLATHERFIFIQLCNILTTVVAPILNIIILYLGYGSIGMSMASLALIILVRLIQILYVRRTLSLSPKYERPKKSFLQDIMKFSFWVLVGDLAGMLYNATDTVIIGTIPALATVGAAIYNVGITFPNIMFSLAQVTPTLFMPKANEMVFSGASNRDLTNLVIQVGRLQGIVVILFCTGFVSFGQPFLHWYVGPEYWESYWVAIIILIPNCIPLVQSAANSILQAKNMHRFRALLYLGIAAVNVVATWFLVQSYGIIGAAIPTGVSFLLGNGLILNWYYWKKVCLDIPRFWKNMLPIIASGAVLCITTHILARFIDFRKLSFLITGILIYILLYCVILWFFVLTPAEKDIFSAPIKKIKNRFMHQKG